MTGSLLLLLFVTLERLGELWLARHNTAKLLEKGAFEVASAHYPVIVILHASWLIGLWWFAFNHLIDGFWLFLFALLQILRLWTLTTLGARWTTRIVILPNASLVKKGPYRFLSHPNYAVVIGEIAVLPLCFNLPYFAIIFSVLNAMILVIRIKAENMALREICNETR